MKFGRQKKVSTDIEDYYSVNIRSIWSGLKQESASFWWLCIYVFFEYVRPQNIYTFIDVIPWSQITLLLAVATAYSDKSLRYPRIRMNSLFIIFYCIVFLSIIFAFNTAISLKEINVIVNWIIVYFLIITVVNTEKRYFVFTLLFLLVSFKMSQHGFRSFALRGFSFAGWGVTGSPGWFQNSGEFGIQLAIFTPLSVAFILALRERWGRIKKFFFYLMPITGLFSIIATSSRGALLAIIVVGIWFMVKSRLGLKSAFGILIVGWALYVVMPSEFKAEFETMGEDSTSVSRLDLWEFGIDTAREYPVLGIGYNNWLYYCWFKGGVGPTKSCHEAHNTFVETATELGFPGLLVFIMMILSMFKLNALSRIYAKQANNKFLLYIAYGLDGGGVGLLVSSLFISVLFYPFFWLQFSMVVALFSIAKKLGSESAFSKL